jgi:hypothetical protein
MLEKSAFNSEPLLGVFILGSDALFPEKSKDSYYLAFTPDPFFGRHDSTSHERHHSQGHTAN